MIDNNGNAKIVYAMIDAIHRNAAYLSEIDGATGDGDHGINMDKGFQLAQTRINENEKFSDALLILSRTLLMDIGGSMGPIYGTLFYEISKYLNDLESFSVADLYTGLSNGVTALENLAGAKLGDKTLIDTLVPCLESMHHAIQENKSDVDVLLAMKNGAYLGKESTREMQAKIGRAARLGDRSIGFLDAGATSCYILIESLVDSVVEQNGS